MDNWFLLTESSGDIQQIPTPEYPESVEVPEGCLLGYHDGDERILYVAPTQFEKQFSEIEEAQEHLNFLIEELRAML